MAHPHLNFGEVWETERFLHSLTIENGGSGSVEIVGFSTSCSCVSIEPSSFTLEQGDSQKLRMTINLTAQSSANGEVTVRVRPRFADGQHGPEWSITGKVKRGLLVQREVYLGRFSEIDQPLSPTPIQVESAIPLQSLSATMEAPGLVAASSPNNTEPMKYVVIVSGSSVLPVGTVEGWLILKAVLPGGQELPVRKVHVRGNVVPEIEVIPPVVQVGGRRLGESFEETVLLRSLSGHHLDGIRFEAEGAGLSVEALGKAGEFRVRQHIARIGAQRTTVYLTMQAKGRALKLRLPVEYTGIENE